MAAKDETQLQSGSSGFKHRSVIWKKAEASPFLAESEEEDEFK